MQKKTKIRFSFLVIQKYSLFCSFEVFAMYTYIECRIDKTILLKFTGWMGVGGQNSKLFSVDLIKIVFFFSRKLKNTPKFRYETNNFETVRKLKEVLQMVRLDENLH